MKIVPITDAVMLLCLEMQAPYDTNFNMQMYRII